tara:strand:- start:79 stop:369 length:291 start_codon:yes stop_codon:yes gene_type:complete
MLHEAIRELYSNAVLIQGNNVNDVVVKDVHGKPIIINNDDVKAKKTELENATSYIHARKNDYPSIADQLDDIYHNGIDAWKATIKEVKDNHPKPSE